MSKKISQFKQVDELNDDALIPIVQNDIDETTDNYTIKFSKLLSLIGKSFDNLIIKVVNSLKSDSEVDALSAAQGKILDENKVDKINGKELSSNDFTTELKDKLEGIQSGAQKNPNLKTIGGETIIGVGDIPVSAFGKVIDNLDTFDGGLPLSAKQGVILNRPATYEYNGLVRPDGITVKITADGKLYTGDEEIKSYKVFIFKKSNTEPATPNINDNTSLSDPDPNNWVVDPSSPYWGWVDYPTDNERWWMSTGIVDGVKDKVTTWSTPMNISGIPGEDGRYTEFRFSEGNFVSYPRFNKDPNHPNSPNNNALWSLSIPENVPDTKTIWMTQSLSEKGQYSSWSTPVKIKGEDGRDGLNIEYVYKTTMEGVKPHTPVAPHENQDDDVPVGWTDNPSGISSVARYEWMSTRLKQSSSWGPFKEPVLWAYYATDGKDGKMPNWMTYIFKQSSTQPSTPDFDTPYANDWDNPDGWQDNPGIGYNWWLSIGTVDGPTELISNWTTPVRVTGEKGDNGDWVDFKFGKGTMTTYPPFSSNTQNPGNDWKDTIDELGNIDYNKDAIWMISAKVVNDVYEKWSRPKRVTAEDGMDGKGIEFIFKLTKTSEPVPVKPVAPNNDPSMDDNYPNDWTDNQQGVTEIWRYEWVSKRTKTDNIWSTYTEPAIWANYSEDGTDGEDGQDGSSVEFIFSRTTEEEAPSPPTYSNEDNYVPSGWTSLSMGVSLENPFEWMCSRKKMNGLWGSWSVVGLFARYSKDGIDGGGFATVYLGEWSATRQYEGSNTLRQIVKYNNKYYWSRQEAGLIPIGTLPTVNTYWEEFAEQYENLATGFLFAEGAQIGDWFISGGKIVSTLDNGDVTKIELDAHIPQITAISKDSGYYPDPNYQGGTTLKMNADRGVFEARGNSSSTSYNVSYISSSGVFSNTAGTEALPASSGALAKAAIVGLGFGTMNDSGFFDRNVMAGVYGRSSNNGNGSHYGGYFLKLAGVGFTIPPRYITDSPSTVRLNEYDSMCIGLVNNKQTTTVILPNSAYEGHIIFIKQMGAGQMKIMPDAGQNLHYDNSVNNDDLYITQGQIGVLIFGKWNHGGVNKDIWCFSKFSF